MECNPKEFYKERIKGTDSQELHTKVLAYILQIPNIETAGGTIAPYYNLRSLLIYINSSEEANERWTRYKQGPGKKARLTLIRRKHCFKSESCTCTIIR